MRRGTLYVVATPLGHLGDLTARAAALLHRGPLSIEIRDFVRKSLENEADWHRDVIEARLAPHVYLGPAWFSRDPAGWSPLGWYPYGVPSP